MPTFNITRRSSNKPITSDMPPSNTPDRDPLEIPEIVEVIFRNLDNKSLLACRELSKTWYTEAMKYLKKRNYGKEFDLYKQVKTEEEFEALKNLLDNSKDPDMLLQSLKTDVSYYPSIFYPRFRDIVPVYGSLLNNLGLYIDRKFIPENIFMHLIHTPHIQSLSVCFATNDKLELQYEHLWCLPAFKLPNLTHFEFKYNVQKSYSLKLCVKIFKDIIRSTRALQCIEIESKFLHHFLKPLYQNEGMKKKMRYIKSFRVHDGTKIRGRNALCDHSGIQKTLPIFAKNLENLGIFAADVDFMVPYLPWMPKLKTLMIQDITGNISPTCITGLAKSMKTPKLRELLVGCAKNEAKYSWPLSPQTKWISNLIWQEGVRRFDDIPHVNKDVCSCAHSERKLLAVVSSGVQKDAVEYDLIVQEVAELKPTSLFLNLDYSDEKFKDDMVSKCLKEIRKLHGCFLHWYVDRTQP